MKPIGHDGKPMSDQAYKRLHALIARLEIKYNVRVVNENDLKEMEAKGA